MALALALQIEVPTFGCAVFEPDGGVVASAIRELGGQNATDLAPCDRFVICRECFVDHADPGAARDLSEIEVIGKDFRHLAGHRVGDVGFVCCAEQGVLNQGGPQFDLGNHGYSLQLGGEAKRIAGNTQSIEVRVSLQRVVSWIACHAELVRAWIIFPDCPLRTLRAIISDRMNVVASLSITPTRLSRLSAVSLERVRSLRSICKSVSAIWSS